MLRYTLHGEQPDAVAFLIRAMPITSASGNERIFIAIPQIYAAKETYFARRGEANLFHPFLPRRGGDGPKEFDGMSKGEFAQVTITEERGNNHEGFYRSQTPRFRRFGQAVIAAIAITKSDRTL